MDDKKEGWLSKALGEQRKEIMSRLKFFVVIVSLVLAGGISWGVLRTVVTQNQIEIETLKDKCSTMELWKASASTMNSEVIKRLDKLDLKLDRLIEKAHYHRNK